MPTFHTVGEGTEQLQSRADQSAMAKQIARWVANGSTIKARRTRLKRVRAATGGDGRRLLELIHDIQFVDYLAGQEVLDLDVYERFIDLAGPERERGWQPRMLLSAAILQYLQSWGTVFALDEEDEEVVVLKLHEENPEDDDQAM